MARKVINNRFGVLTGWNNIKVNILGRDLEGITEVEYSDEKNFTPEYGAGDSPVGMSTGNYSAKASISLYWEEVRALLESLPKGSRIQDVPAFDVIVEYEFNNEVIKDVINACHFKNNGVALKQGDGKVITKIELPCMDITWNK